MSDHLQTNPNPDTRDNRPFVDITLGAIAIALGTISLILQSNGLLSEAQSLKGILTDPSWELMGVAAFSISLGTLRDFRMNRMKKNQPTE